MSEKNEPTLFAKHVCRVLVNAGFSIEDKLQRNILALADTDDCYLWPLIWEETTKAIYQFNQEDQGKASRTMTALALGVTPGAASMLNHVLLLLTRETRPHPFKMEDYVINTDDDRYAMATYLFMWATTTSSMMPTLPGTVGKLVKVTNHHDFEWKTARQRMIGMSLFGAAWDCLYASEHYNGAHIVEQVMLARPPFTGSHADAELSVELPGSMLPGV